MKKENAKRIEAFEMKYYRRMLRIPWTAKKSNATVLIEAQAERELLFWIRKRKLQYFGHVVRQDSSLEKDILLGMTEGERKQGRPRISWMCNITSWASMTIVEAYRRAQDRRRWRAVIRSMIHHLNDDMDS